MAQARQLGARDGDRRRDAWVDADRRPCRHCGINDHSTSASPQRGDIRLLDVPRVRTSRPDTRCEETRFALELVFLIEPRVVSDIAFTP